MARKQKQAPLPTMSLVFVGLACFFIFGAGAGYLWNKSQIHTLGQQIRGLEGKFDDVKRRRMALERVYAAMCSQSNLDARVRSMKLEIGPPQPDQLIRLWENPADARDERLVARTIELSEGSN
jgi:hypothetical protein